MKNTLIHLCSPIEHPIIGLETDFGVNSPGRLYAKVIKYEAKKYACMHPQAVMMIC